MSLCQYLDLQDQAFLRVILEKYGIWVGEVPYPVLDTLRPVLQAASQEQLQGLLSEIARTRFDLRNRVAPRYRHDERWDDLESCLLLDGYKVEGNRLISIEPTIDGAEPLEDNLSSEIRSSGLSEAEGILGILANSAEAFRRAPPDYNGCLSNARVALQTLATAIAKARQQTHPGTYDETKWGQILDYLRTTGFITEAEEKGLAGVYGFISPGAHTPIGLSEQEMARLGRSLAVTMCYFLVKKHNAQSN